MTSATSPSRVYPFLKEQASTSEEMNTQAIILEDMMSFFNIDEDSQAVKLKKTDQSNGTHYIVFFHQPSYAEKLADLELESPFSA